MRTLKAITNILVSIKQDCFSIHNHLKANSPRLSWNFLFDLAWVLVSALTLSTRIKPYRINSLNCILCVGQEMFERGLLKT